MFRDGESMICPSCHADDSWDVLDQHWVLHCFGPVPSASLTKAVVAPACDKAPVLRSGDYHDVHSDVIVWVPHAVAESDVAAP